MSDTNKIKNLWGDLPIEENIRTPYVMFKEQASLLTEATNGLLVGDVFKSKGIDYTVCRLDIKAPAIDNYQVAIVSAKYNITIYPVQIKSFFTDFYTECNTQEELEAALEKILSSQEVRRIVASLLSEIRADEQEVNI